MSNIVVGKYTLESLTNGMYASPFDLFREYIQNAVDSIDDAIEQGIIKPNEARIVIELNKDNRRIRVSDNGTGILQEKVERILLDIGNSEKDRASNRGFRGIGRLAGLGYCERLTFLTSYKGEMKKAQVVFDAKTLKEKLHSKGSAEESIFDVLEAVTECKNSVEKEKLHYFSVELNGVDVTSGLLEEESVKAYLVQNLPLKYKDSFRWGRVIDKKVANAGYNIPSYPIYFNTNGREEPLYKSYDNALVSDRVKKYVKNIDDIEIVPFCVNDKLTAILWYAKLEYAGTILDDYVKGIRIRQGNLLIGSKNTANQYFKEERFNGWLIGELFVVSDDLIPNARRDDFEDNEEYIELKKQLSEWSFAITKEIRKISLERSSSAEKRQVIEQASNDVDENGLIMEDVSFADEDDMIRGEVDEATYVAESELFDRFQILLGQKGNNYKYRVLNLRDDIPHDQRKVLERVFDAIGRCYSQKKVNTLIEEIIKNY